MGVDMEDPYNIYGGLQDHDSWKGPSNGWAGEIGPADWVTVGEGDGMYNCVDPADSRWLYNNREMGAMWRFDQKTGLQTTITPKRSETGKDALRFNWTPPIALSPHNPAIVYTGAQVVFRSLDRGERWQEISPDLTTDEDAKQHGESYISYCTITTLAESPVEPGVIWAGTDDGKVQVTKDGGANWLDRTARLAAAGGPANFWTSRVFPSPHEAGHGLRQQDGVAARRLPDLHPQDDRLRRDLDLDRRGPAGRQADQRRRPGPEEPRAPVRGDGVGRLRHARRRETLAAVQGGHAVGQDHGPGRPSARERPGRGDLRAGCLCRRRHGAPGDDGGRARRGRPPVRHRAGDAEGDQRARQLPVTRRQPPVHAERAQRRRRQLLAQGQGGGRGQGHRGRRLGRRAGRAHGQERARAQHRVVGHAAAAAGRGRAETGGLERRAPGRARRVHSDARGGGQEARQEGRHPPSPGLDGRPDAHRLKIGGYDTHFPFINVRISPEK
ncbi:MAG: hypothetical protein MZV63_65365 [Marinilabiliales bacterium]|nr:hypothetical protein [Marinilabiliales bacterium]